MRPVNLIPPEQRRGDRAPLRSGPLAYVVVGALAAALIAVTALVLTGNSITERQNELETLEVERDAAQARASALAPYAEFALLKKAREETIGSLAKSRFDWERVLRELALVLPPKVSLASLEGAAGDPSAPIDEDAAGPTLKLDGCAANQKTVAELAAALNDIDGVTRVQLVESQRAGSSDGETQGNAGECASRPSLATFQLEAAFEAVAAAPLDPVAPEGLSAGAVPANSQAEQLENADQAVGLVPGAGE